MYKQNTFRSVKIFVTFLLPTDIYTISLSKWDELLIYLPIWGKVGSYIHTHSKNTQGNYLNSSLEIYLLGHNILLKCNVPIPTMVGSLRTKVNCDKNQTNS